HTKKSWSLISKIEPSIKDFVYGDTEPPHLNNGEICIIVTGDRIIEASSRPTRTYVKFDRNIFRELIEDYAEMSNCDRYFLLDREFHFFDIDYLRSRFESHKLNDAVDVRFPNQGTKVAASEKVIRTVHSDSMDETPTTDSEREDMYEALADA
ncbi:MAG: hypothetical protein JRI73_14255, partial [Deltaproteobacteria bacterium]|nr:hypothetical protein [Deltaproteobacteria bacterium]